MIKKPFLHLFFAIEGACCQCAKMLLPDYDYVTVCQNACQFQVQACC